MSRALSMNGEKKVAYWNFSGKARRKKDHSKDLEIGGRIIIK
jgi:hypothetical protein